MFFIVRAAREMAASRCLASYRTMPATRILLLLITVLTLVGCGDGLAKVSGKVTLDGQPVVGGSRMYGTVNFYPASGNGVPAVGGIDESGHYQLKSGSRNGTAAGT